MTLDTKSYAEQWPRVTMTPELLQILNNKLPEHGYHDAVPIKVLLNPELELTNLPKLLNGVKLLYRPKAIPAVNEAHRTRMRQLKVALEEQQYQAMIAQSANSSLAETRQELRIVKNQISTVINVLISIFTAAMAAWYWTTSWTTGNRVLAALMSSIVLGAIETFLYMRYLSKIDMHKEYNKKQGSGVTSKKKKQ